MNKTLPQGVNTPKASTVYQNSGAWGNLAESYKLRLRLCDKEGTLLEDPHQIVCVPIDADLSISSQYSTPFDNSNPEHRLPTMMGMLQSGDWVNTLEIGLNSIFGVELSEERKEGLNSLEGRSNLTKVNSTQIFVSTEPLTISATLCFIAWRNASIEVERQLALLKQWALPIELSDGSVLASALQDKSLMSLFPSQAPPFVSMIYGGKRYTPLLIRDVSEPLVVPFDSDSNRLYAQVQVTLMSRNALDRRSIDAFYGA